MATAQDTCSVDGCDKFAKKRGYCRAHYERVRVTGSPGPAEVRRYCPQPTTCTVTGCDEIPYGRGLCQMHYVRWWRKGDPGAAGTERGVRTNITYASTHTRLRDRRGKASGYSCDRCGGVAIDWAYNHSSPDVQYEPLSGMPYSVDLDCYIPLCRVCHKWFDFHTPRQR